MTAKQTCDLVNAMEALGYEIYYIRELKPQDIPEIPGSIEIKLCIPKTPLADRTNK